MSSPERVVKIVVVGDAAVGKTLLIKRLTEAKSDSTQPTLGVEFSRKDFVIEGKLIVAQIWDTAGQERFRGLPKLYYRNANGILLVFDVSDHESFENCKTKWAEEIKDHCPPNVPILLVGNKADLAERKVSEESALTFAKERGFSSYLETSAKSEINVFLAFQKLIEAMMGSDGKAVQIKFKKSLSKDAARRKRSISASNSRLPAFMQQQSYPSSPSRSNSDAAPKKGGFLSTEKAAPPTIKLEAPPESGKSGRRKKKECCQK